MNRVIVLCLLLQAVFTVGELKENPAGVTYVDGKAPADLKAGPVKNSTIRIEPITHAAFIRSGSREVPKDDEIENEEFERYIKEHHRPTIETVFVSASPAPKTSEETEDSKEEKDAESISLKSQAEFFKRPAKYQTFERSVALPSIPSHQPHEATFSILGGGLSYGGGDGIIVQGDGGQISGLGDGQYVISGGGDQLYQVSPSVVPTVFPVSTVIPGTINVAEHGLKTKTFQIRRPAIQKHYYDIEERVIIRPAGSILVELDRPVAKIPTGETVVALGGNGFQQGGIGILRGAGGGGGGVSGIGIQQSQGGLGQSQGGIGIALDGGLGGVGIQQSQGGAGQSQGGIGIVADGGLAGVGIQQGQGGRGQQGVGIGVGGGVGGVGIQQGQGGGQPQQGLGIGAGGGVGGVGIQQGQGQGGGGQSQQGVGIGAGGGQGGVGGVGIQQGQGGGGQSQQGVGIGAGGGQGGVGGVGIQQGQGGGGQSQQGVGIGASGGVGGVGIQQGQGQGGGGQSQQGVGIAAGGGQGGVGGVGIQQGQGGGGQSQQGLGIGAGGGVAGVGIQQGQGGGGQSQQGLGISAGGAASGVGIQQTTFPTSTTFSTPTSVFGFGRPQGTFQQTPSGLVYTTIASSAAPTTPTYFFSGSPGFPGFQQTPSGVIYSTTISSYPAATPTPSIIIGSPQQSQGGIGIASGGGLAGVGVQQSQSGIGIASGGGLAGVGVQQSQSGIGIASGGLAGVGVQQSQSGIGISSGGSQGGLGGVGVQQSQGGIFYSTTSAPFIPSPTPTVSIGGPQRGISGVGFQQSQGGIGIASAGPQGGLVGVGVQQQQGGFYSTTPGPYLPPVRGPSYHTTAGSAITTTPIQTSKEDSVVVEARTNVKNRGVFSSTTTTERSFSSSVDQDASAYAKGSVQAVSRKITPFMISVGEPNFQYPPYVEINSHGSPIGHLHLHPYAQVQASGQDYPRMRYQGQLLTGEVRVDDGPNQHNQHPGYGALSKSHGTYDSPAHVVELPAEAPYEEHRANSQFVGSSHQPLQTASSTSGSHQQLNQVYQHYFVTTSSQPVRITEVQQQSSDEINSRPVYVARHHGRPNLVAQIRHQQAAQQKHAAQLNQQHVTSYTEPTVEAPEVQSSTHRQSDDSVYSQHVLSTTTHQPEAYTSGKRLYHQHGAPLKYTQHHATSAAPSQHDIFFKSHPLSAEISGTRQNLEIPPAVEDSSLRSAIESSTPAATDSSTTSGQQHVKSYATILANHQPGIIYASSGPSVAPHPQHTARFSSEGSTLFSPSGQQLHFAYSQPSHTAYTQSSESRQHHDSVQTPVTHERQIVTGAAQQTSPQRSGDGSSSSPRQLHFFYSQPSHSAYIKQPNEHRHQNKADYQTATVSSTTPVAVFSAEGSTLFSPSDRQLHFAYSQPSRAAYTVSTVTPVHVQSSHARVQSQEPETHQRQVQLSFRGQSASNNEPSVSLTTPSVVSSSTEGSTLSGRQLHFSYSQPSRDVSVTPVERGHAPATHQRQIQLSFRGQSASSTESSQQNNGVPSSTPSADVSRHLHFSYSHPSRAAYDQSSSEKHHSEDLQAQIPITHQRQVQLSASAAHSSTTPQPSSVPTKKPMVKQKYRNEQTRGALTLRSGRTYGDHRVIASTPAPRDGGAASESVQTRRIVVNHPFQTVQEVVEQEPITKYRQVAVNAPAAHHGDLQKDQQKASPSHPAATYDHPAAAFSYHHGGSH